MSHSIFRRETLAAAALQGILAGLYANTELFSELANRNDGDESKVRQAITWEAVQLADSLINELDKAAG